MRIAMKNPEKPTLSNTGKHLSSSASSVLLGSGSTFQQAPYVLSSSYFLPVFSLTNMSY